MKESICPKCGSADYYPCFKGEFRPAIVAFLEGDFLYYECPKCKTKFHEEGIVEVKND